MEDSHKPASSNNMVQEAIDNNCLFELFAGKFRKSSSQYGDIPTDSEFVFRSWSAYVESRREVKNELWILFSEAVLRLSNEAELSWFAIYYLHLLLNYKHPFSDSEMQKFIDEICFNIELHKNKLMSDYRWVGNQNYNYSIWDDVLRMADILASQFPYHFTLTR